MSWTLNDGKHFQLTPDGAHPSAFIQTKLHEFYIRQLQLCNRLEALADNLPDNFNAQDALILARQILPLLKEAHHFEEESLFILLPTDEEGMAQSLERLKFEHWEDETSAEDLVDIMISYACNAQPELTDKLSYMLRGFFDNLRRHIAFENEHILPAIKNSADNSTAKT